MKSAKSAPRKSVAFISGPINTGSDGHYFHTHYAPKITEAVKHGDDFVIGPIPSGVDAEALDYLLAYPVSPTRITIFVTPAEEGMWGAHLRARGVHLHVVDGQMSRERDAALTSASDYDILRLRTDDEAQTFYGQLWRAGYVTNTERNWKRRHGIGEDVAITAEEINRAVEISPETPFQPDIPRDAAYDGEWAIRELYVQLSDRQSEAVSEPPMLFSPALANPPRIERQASRPDSTS